jgi:hypothetical protein
MYNRNSHLSGKIVDNSRVFGKSPGHLFDFGFRRVGFKVSFHILVMLEGTMTLTSCRIAISISQHLLDITMFIAAYR